MLHSVRELPQAKAEPIQVALVGNPNSGKTTLFNALTGARQRVGNYPGVTVERRSATTSISDQPFEIHDLPGTYSLTSWSPEERITQAELLARRHDLFVVVADATTLRRSLVLLAQVLQLGVRTVLCLNMADEAKNAGMRIDMAQMEALLGCTVLQTVGHRGVGVEELRVAMTDAIAGDPPPNRVVLGQSLQQALSAIQAKLGDTGHAPSLDSWVAQKLLVGEGSFMESVRSRGGDDALAEAGSWRERLEQQSRTEIAVFVAEQYHGFIAGLLREVVQQPPRPDAREVSDKIDRVLAHRILGLPLFAGVMYGIFWLTFVAGEIPMGWIEAGFAALGEAVSSLWSQGSESLLRSLLVDGIIAGVGGVIVFLPNILLLFLGLAFLEDSGYMARAAFLMDRVMHRFSLHGRSFLPMMTGFGCSIPGIMATRTLENERDRLTTMLVLPLMSCGARLPIWMLLIPAFFPSSLQAPALFGVYATGILLALVLSLVLRKTLLKGDEAPFVMELPPYRLPTLSAIASKVIERAMVYLKKAGTIILGVSILMWCITAFPRLDTFVVDADVAAGRIVVAAADADAAGVSATRAAAADGVEVITVDQLEHRRNAESLEHSIAGRIGKSIEPAVAPLGFDWKLATAMIGAFAAKEVFVSQMGIVYSLGEGDPTSEGLRRTLHRDYSPLVGLSLMLFLLISAPCMATIAVTRRESGSWKWAMLQLGGLTALGYVISLLVFQIGSLIV